MKKRNLVILFFITIIILIISYSLFLKPNNNPSYKVSEFEKIGYTKSEIDNLNRLENPNNILKYDYNKNIINIINDKNFNEKYLDNYIKLLNLTSLEIEDIIFICNKNFFNENIEYTEKTVALMKQEYFKLDNLDRYLNYRVIPDFDTENNELKYIITMVNSNRDYEYYTNVNKTDLSKKTLIIANKYNVLDNDYIPDNMVKIEDKYGISGYLVDEVYESYKKMWNAAKSEGLSLYIRSPYRSYTTQNNLYQSYAKRDGYNEADTYSARPGYSEHQTGLAFDVTSTSTTLGNFEYTKEFNWLQEHAHEYGFILRYPKNKQNITGYVYESWHYRYVGSDVAKIIKDKDITFEEYYEYYVK